MLRLKRALSFLVDFFFSFSLTALLTSIITTYRSSHGLEKYTNWVFVLIVLFFCLFLLVRDIGVSLGKRIFKLRVCSLDGKPVTILQRIVRNLPTVVFLWEVETIFLIVTGRRLGDMLAKTMVMNISPEVMMNDNKN